MKHRLAMVDIDGVVADDRHRVHHAMSRAWGDYFSLMPRDGVWPQGRELHDAVHVTDWDLSWLTGRREDTRPMTRDWLQRHGFDHRAPLIMRKLHDRRKLPELKALIVREALYVYDEVVLYDDDPLVIEAVQSVPGARAVWCGWHTKPNRLVQRGAA